MKNSELYSILQNHCEFIKANVFDIMPLQFYIQIDMNMPNAMNNALAPFYTIFNMLEEVKPVLEGIYATKDIHSDSIIDESIINVNLIKSDIVSQTNKNGYATKFKSFNFQRNQGKSGHTKLEMPMSHYIGKNFWILKATNLNRGRGIHVFNSLESLKSLIEEQWKCTENIGNTKQKNTKNKVMMIIQKYIERPLLVYKRKFDIRVWVLVSSTGK